MFPFTEKSRKEFLNKQRQSFNELAKSMRDFDFDDFLERIKRTPVAKTNIVENKYSYLLEVPGFDKKDLTLKLDDGLLTLKGKTMVCGISRDISYEIEVGEDKVLSAKLEKGIMTVTLESVSVVEKDTEINIE